MKKILTFLFALVAVLGLASCGKAVENPEKDYYVSGQFADWKVGEREDLKMVAVAANDKAVRKLKIKSAKYVYAVEVVFPSEKASWQEKVKNGEEIIEFDGNLALKVVRTAKGDPESMDFWAQNKESGEVKNLSPETLFVPAYREQDQADGQSTWGGNCCVREAGTYTIVFVEFEDGSLGMGAVKK